MAKKNKKQQNDGIIINNLTTFQLQRTTKDIEDWRKATRSAENVRFPRRRPLYEIYNDILLDGLVTSLRGKRLRPVIGKPIVYKNRDGDIDETMTEIAKQPWFSILQEHILDARFWGHSLIEPETKMGLISDIELIPRHHVVPEKGMVYKIYFDESSAIHYRNTPVGDRLLEVGRKKDLGLFLAVTPYVLYKRILLADWSNLAEIWGHPLRVYKYNPYDATSRQEIVKQAEAQGSAAYIIMPDGVELDIIKGMETANSSIFKDLKATLDEELAITMVGQTMTTKDGSSKSQAQVHLSEQISINHEDMMYVQNMLSYPGQTFFRNWGLPVREGYFWAYDTTEQLPMTDRIEVDRVLNDIIDMPPEHFYTRYDVAIPESGPSLKVNTTLPDQAEDKEAKPTNAMGVYLAVNELYHDIEVPNYDNVRVPKKGFKDIDKIINAIFNGTLSSGEVDKSLFLYYGDKLLQAIETGYNTKLSKLDKKSTAYKNMKRLHNNSYTFAAHKVYQEIRFMAGLLKDSGGKKLSEKQFRKVALRVHKDYGVNFLRTEVDASVNAAQTAKEWQRFEENKEDLPNVIFRTVEDSKVRESHDKLNGKVFPIGSADADIFAPPIGYGCRCDYENTDEPVSKGAVPDIDIPDVFLHNPGKSGEVFGKAHSYFDVPKKDKKAAEKNFGLKTPKADG